MFFSNVGSKGHPPTHPIFLDLMFFFKEKLAKWRVNILQRVGAPMWEILSPPLSLIHLSDYWVIKLFLKNEVEDIADMSSYCSLYSSFYYATTFSLVCTLQVTSLVWTSIQLQGTQLHIWIVALSTIHVKKFKLILETELIINRSRGNENTHWVRIKLSIFHPHCCGIFLLKIKVNMCKMNTTWT